MPLYRFPKCKIKKKSGHLQLPKEHYLRVVEGPLPYPQNKSWRELHKGDIMKRTCPLDPNNCKSVNQETDSKPFKAVKVNI